MPLSSGSSLGPYEILAPLGAGGMGEVYRARDSRLGRDVAIKVLPASFAENADRLRRFEQEARATGMLNHPNILAVYDVGSHDGAPYLVTELLEGQTLREELPVTRRKALDYARQVATGLAAAHAKGVTHRDLKPENIFVTVDGRVKILDFGLAKVAADDAIELTRTAGTTPGVALGTIGYMSPEQARGKSADARSDIFSFGVILYEMLSGERAFHRDSAMDTISAILKEDPPPLSDAALEKIVRRCLEKSAEQRFQSAADLGFAIEALSGLSSTILPLQNAPPIARGRTLAVAALGVFCVMLGVAAGIWWHARQNTTPSWSAVQLGGADISYGPRVSPNGQMVAFVAIIDGNSQVAVMNPASGDWNVLTHERNKGYVDSVCWSRDSASIYFDRYIEVPRGIYSVPAVGGEERLILEDAAIPETLPDGSLLLVRLNAKRQTQMHRFWPETSRLQALPVDLSLRGRISIRAFPDGREAAFNGRPLNEPASQSDANWGYYIIDLASEAVRRVAPDLKAPSNVAALGVSASGQSLLLVSQSGDLFQLAEVPRNGHAAARVILPLTTYSWSIDATNDGSIYLDQVERPFDALRYGAAGGNPERIVGAADAASGTSWSQAPDERILFAAPAAGRYRVLAARPGKNAVPLAQTGEDTWEPTVLPGRGEAAFLIGKFDDPATWIVAVGSLSDGRILRRLASTKGVEARGLASSPDGKIIYYVAAGSIWSVPAAGGETRKLTAGDSLAADPNGRDLIVVRNEKEAAHLFQVSLNGAPERLIPLPEGIGLNNLAPSAVSRDGRIALSVIVSDSWWDESAILDRSTGKLQRLKVAYTGDVDQIGWASDGRIIAGCRRLQSRLWRFRMAKP